MSSNITSSKTSTVWKDGISLTHGEERCEPRESNPETIPANPEDSVMADVSMTHEHDSLYDNLTYCQQDSSYPHVTIIVLACICPISLSDTVLSAEQHHGKLTLHLRTHTNVSCGKNFQRLLPDHPFRRCFRLCGLRVLSSHTPKAKSIDVVAAL